MRKRTWQEALVYEPIDKELDVIENRDSYDNMMRADIDYALSQLSPDMVKDAVALLKLTVKTMAKYGHEITVGDLMDIS